MNATADIASDFCQRFMIELREAMWFDKEGMYGNYYAYVFEAERACDACDLRKLRIAVDDALLALQQRQGKCLVAWHWIGELERWSRQLCRVW